MVIPQDLLDDFDARLNSTVISDLNTKDFEEICEILAEQLVAVQNTAAWVEKNLDAYVNCIEEFEEEVSQLGEHVTRLEGKILFRKQKEIEQNRRRILNLARIVALLKGEV